MPSTTINDATNDAAALREMGDRLRKTRLGANLTQADIAKRTGLSARTITRIESGEDARMSAYIKYLRALGMLSNLDTLVPPLEMRPSEYLERKPVRRRASGKGTTCAHVSQGNSGAWKWGDEQ